MVSVTFGRDGGLSRRLEGETSSWSTSMGPGSCASPKASSCVGFVCCQTMTSSGKDSERRTGGLIPKDDLGGIYFSRNMMFVIRGTTSDKENSGQSSLLAGIIKSKKIRTKSEQSTRGQTEAAMTETNPPPNKQKPHIHIFTEVGIKIRGHNST